MADRGAGAARHLCDLVRWLFYRAAARRPNLSRPNHPVSARADVVIDTVLTARGATPNRRDNLRSARPRRSLLRGPRRRRQPPRTRPWKAACRRLSATAEVRKKRWPASRRPLSPRQQDPAGKELQTPAFDPPTFLAARLPGQRRAPLPVFGPPGFASECARAREAQMEERSDEIVAY